MTIKTVTVGTTSFEARLATVGDILFASELLFEKAEIRTIDYYLDLLSRLVQGQEDAKTFLQSIEITDANPVVLLESLHAVLEELYMLGPVSNTDNSPKVDEQPTVALEQPTPNPEPTATLTPSESPSTPTLSDEQEPTSSETQAGV